MTYDFETIMPAAGTSLPMQNGFHTHTPEAPNEVNFGVAEMKFALAQPIRDALQEVITVGSFGYHDLSARYYETVCGWMANRHGWEIRPEWLCQIFGVVGGIGIALRAFTAPGDRVIIQPPVYGPFSSSCIRNDRVIAENPLVLRDGRWEMDYEGFEALAADEHTTAFILCSPHNPVGRVWTREELQRIAVLCEKYNLFVISDEIHMDLIFPGHEHTMFGSLSDWARSHCVVLTSPSKGFNLAGLTLANAIIPHEENRARFGAVAKRDMGGHYNVMSYAACGAAYGKSEGWLDALIAYIDENRREFGRLLAQKLPRAVLYEAEGTYLMWVDLSAYGWSEEQIMKRFCEDAHFYVEAGSEFTRGQTCSCIRVNLACPRRCIREAMERLAGEN